MSRASVFGLMHRPVDGVDIPLARNILAYNMRRSVDL